MVHALGRRTDQLQRIALQGRPVVHTEVPLCPCGSAVECSRPRVCPAGAGALGARSLCGHRPAASCYERAQPVCGLLRRTGAVPHLPKGKRRRGTLRHDHLSGLRRLRPRQPFGRPHAVADRRIHVPYRQDRLEAGRGRCTLYPPQRTACGVCGFPVGGEPTLCGPARLRPADAGRAEEDTGDRGPARRLRAYPARGRRGRQRLPCEQLQRAELAACAAEEPAVGRNVAPRYDGGSARRRVGFRACGGR